MGAEASRLIPLASVLWKKQEIRKGTRAEYAGLRRAVAPGPLGVLY